MCSRVSAKFRISMSAGSLRSTDPAHLLAWARARTTRRGVARQRAGNCEGCEDGKGEDLNFKLHSWAKEGIKRVERFERQGRLGWMSEDSGDNQVNERMLTFLAL